MQDLMEHTVLVPEDFECFLLQLFVAAHSAWQDSTVLEQFSSFWSAPQWLCLKAFEGWMEDINAGVAVAVFECVFHWAIGE